MFDIKHRIIIEQKESLDDDVMALYLHQGVRTCRSEIGPG